MKYEIQTSAYDAICDLTGLLNHNNNKYPVPEEIAPLGYTVVLSENQSEKFFRFLDTLVDWHPKLLGLEAPAELLFNQIKIIVDKSPHLSDDYLAFFNQRQIMPMTDINEINFYPWIQTRILNESFVYEMPRYHQFVNIAHIEKNGAVAAISIDFIYMITSTGARFQVLAEPTYSPYGYSIAVYEPDYYKYIFSVLDLETASRFAADHAREKIEFSITYNTNKLLYPLF